MRMKAYYVPGMFETLEIYITYQYISISQLHYQWSFFKNLHFIDKESKAQRD